MLNNLSLAFCAVLVLACVASEISISDYLCHGRGHSTGIRATCCNNQSVTPGIGTAKQWKECAVASTDDDEAYNATMWRIYICMLQKVLPRSQETLTLIDFGKGMTDKYPEALKTKINEEVKHFVSHDKNNKSVAISQVDMKNFEKINEMRAHYFNIEKEICGWTKDLTHKKEELTEIGCSGMEELIHRGGRCCNNKSMPINDYYQEFDNDKPEHCDKTLMKFKEKLESINSTHKSTFLAKCTVSCRLIQKGIITVEDLISFNVTDKLPTEKIMNEFMPKYYSKTVKKDIQHYIKTNFTSELAIQKSNELFIILDPDWKIPAEMNGCTVYSELNWLAFPH